MHPWLTGMGLYSLKTELEDLSLKYRYPEVYNEISEKIKLTEETTAPPDQSFLTAHH